MTWLADITDAAHITGLTLAQAADQLDQITAKHLPVESRRATIEERLTANLMDAGINALTREPFKPRAA